MFSLTRLFVGLAVYVVYLFAIIALFSVLLLGVCQRVH